MKKFLLSLFLIFALMLCGTAVITKKPAKTYEEKKLIKTEIYVFIAASLNNAMAQLSYKFRELHPEVKVVLNADSSGILQTQIEEGAECDLFFSAAEKQMKALKEEGFLLPDSIRNLLENKVVLIKSIGMKSTVSGFDDIYEAKSIALAAESVPAGDYARQIFKKIGVWDKVQAMEINECSNVTAVLSAVAEESNEVGVVYQTDAASMKSSIEVITAALKKSLDSPIIYPAGLVINQEADEAQKDAAKDFLDYLSTDEAKAVFEGYGFTIY